MINWKGKIVETVGIFIYGTQSTWKTKFCMQSYEACNKEEEVNHLSSNDHFSDGLFKLENAN
jgi:hypothetical protein